MDYPYEGTTGLHVGGTYMYVHVLHYIHTPTPYTTLLTLILRLFDCAKLKLLNLNY